MTHDHSKPGAPAALRHARTCYDHLAGELGVGLTRCLVEGGYLAFCGDTIEVTPTGEDFLTGFGVALASVRKQRRKFCRSCLDWTERRNHLGGAAGAALANRLFELKWIERSSRGRTLIVTPIGYQGLRQIFSLELKPLPCSANSKSLIFEVEPQAPARTLPL